jgi:Na+:H+ antiporter, NhaA family
MIVPAIIYVLFNYNKLTISGWRIPMATDIAFALGILSLVGRKANSIGSIILTLVSLGIIFGLVIGKQIGIFGVSYILVKLKVAKLPAQVTKRHLYGASVLGGIGFTMSIFISSLSFADETVLATAKISIMIASILAAIVGGIIFGIIKLKSEK